MTTKLYIMSHLKKHIPSIAMTLVLCAASAFFSLRVTVLVGDFIDGIGGTPLLQGSHMFGLLAEMGLCVAAAGLTMWLTGIINARIAYGFVRGIRQEAFQKVTDIPFSFLDRHQVGDLSGRIINDADSLCDGVLLSVSSLFSGIVTIGITIVLLLRVDIAVSLVIIVGTPASLLVSSVLTGSIRRLFKDQAAARGVQTALVMESVANIKTVKVFGASQRMIDRFAATNTAYVAASSKAVFTSSLVNPVTRFVNALCYAAVLLVGGRAVLHGDVSVGELTVALALAASFAKPFNDISNVLAQLSDAVVCAERLKEIGGQWTADSESGSSCYDIHVRAWAVDSDQATRSKAPAIAFSHVSFSYDDTDSLDKKYVLKDYSIDFAQGQKVAITGPTGCGKTTLFSLLLRFYEHYEGSIRLYGVDIKDIEIADLRSRIGIVLQDSAIVSGTVADNIAIGDPAADREAIIRAAKLSKAHEFIVKKQYGYDTIVSENGDELSSGERQLICITRVMLMKPDILLLDEATASLDAQTERIVTEGFAALMEGRTCLIIAHRPSTIRTADRVVDMGK